MDYSFEEFFKKEGKEPIRAKFLSRVFGVFSEELVRIWANDSRAPYANLGRPTLRQSDAGVKSKSCCKFTLSNPSQLTN